MRGGGTLFDRPHRDLLILSELTNEHQQKCRCASTCFTHFCKNFDGKIVLGTVFGPKCLGRH